MFKMFNSAVTFPAAFSSGIWLPSGLIPVGGKFRVPFTSCLHAIEKDLAISSRAWKTIVPTQASDFRLSKNAEIYHGTDARSWLFLNTCSPESNPVGSIKPSRVKASGKEGKSKRSRSNAAQSNKLDSLLIIRYPLSTESAIKAILENNTLVFVVDERADKMDIREAVKKLLNLRIKKVNTLISPCGTKKAFIMLAPDCNALDVAKKIKIL